MVVDDEQDICEILQFNLESEGYQVDTAHSAEEALHLLTPQHKLILLDVMMEGMSGFQIADRLRKDGNQIPIIFLTARNTENDMLTGFSIGADDFVTKPFSVKEVIARVRSVLRRTANPQTSESTDGCLLCIDGICMDLRTKIVRIDGKAVELTRKEYNILELLIRNPERVFTRTEILDRAWQDDGVVLERTVDVHITRLRKKIAPYGAAIVNRTGYGYAYVPQ